MPANALHIRKVWVGMPRAQVEQLHGAGRQLDNGNVGYGKMYSDGLNSHYPLEVLYSASGEVEAVAGDELYRGGHKVTHKSGEVPIEIFEGKYEAQALIAMIVDEHKPEKAHGSIVFRFDEVHPGYSCTSIDGHDRFIISQQ